MLMLTRAIAYWDSSSSPDEGWAYRLLFSQEEETYEETGDLEVAADDEGGVIVALQAIIEAHGGPVPAVLTADDRPCRSYTWSSE